MTILCHHITDLILEEVDCEMELTCSIVKEHLGVNTCEIEGKKAGLGRGRGRTATQSQKVSLDG